MARLAVTHAFVSTHTATPSDPTLVGGSNWNAGHTMSWSAPTPITVSPYTITTGGGNYLVNKTVGSAQTVNLPAASTMNNESITVADIKGDAATNNITITPNGSEKIQGQANYVISSNYGGVTLNPIPTGGWYLG